MRSALRKRLEHKIRHKIGHRIGDDAVFIRTWLESPLRTGAVSPSGRALATAMAAAVDPDATGPVIELGPGTGPVTDALIRRGVAQSRLVLIEYDADFCLRLARRYPQARVIRGDAYALASTLAGTTGGPAAAIVSGLPLLMKPEAKRIALMEDAFDLLEAGRPFIQFTYGVVSPIPRRSSGNETAVFTAEALAPVWLNLPPARVWVYRRHQSEARPMPRGARRG